MDFSANRLAALAGLASPEVRHEIVREQAEALNESAQARQAEQNESEVRQAVRRTIRKMVQRLNCFVITEDTVSAHLAFYSRSVI